MTLRGLLARAERAAIIHLGWPATLDTRHYARVDRRWGPVGLGLAAGVLSALLPDGIGIVIVLVAALMAGWVLPHEPVKAAALFILPTVVLGFARMLIDDSADAAGDFVLGTVIAIAVTAIFTHVGAGAALRRQQA